MKKLSITKRKPDSKEITPYEQGLNNFQELMNRFFDDPWFRMPSIFGQSLMDRGTFDGWWPKADVSENDKEIKIKMNVPGVDPEKINIEADADAAAAYAAADDAYARKKSQQATFEICRKYIPLDLILSGIKSQEKQKA